jgi:hypothetical protein
MRVATLVIVPTVMVVPACYLGDSGDSRTTARVDRIESDRVCLVPEDADQTDLEGCFPARPSEAEQLRPGDCIDVRIPDQLDAEKTDDPLRSIHVLDRKCDR